MDYNSKLIVEKSTLQGIVKLSGAKNSALRLLAASLLTDEDIEIFNFPAQLLDIQVHAEMLEALGKSVNLKAQSISISSARKTLSMLEYEGRSIRNTLLVLGALTAKTGKGAVPLPGGCKLGERKYDLHVMLLEKMGASVWEENGMLMAEAKAGRLIGSDIVLPLRSTGATENALIAGSLAKGQTRLWNPHIRPELFDLIDLLRKMGSQIEVRGQESILIQGVDCLGGAAHSVMPDNVEALTWLIGAAITKGDVTIEDFPFEHLEVPLIHLRESGVRVFRDQNTAIVRDCMPFPVEISTGPYPGINSDMQPLFATLGVVAKGNSHITDLRFPNRYGYMNELAKMNANFIVNENLLSISGGHPLHGTEVVALDLRAGAALLLAGMIAEGETTISSAWQIARGYNGLEEKLKLLGCKFRHIRDEN